MEAMEELQQSSAAAREMITQYQQNSRSHHLPSNSQPASDPGETQVLNAAPPTWLAPRYHNRRDFNPNPYAGMRNRLPAHLAETTTQSVDPPSVTRAASRGGAPHIHRRIRYEGNENAERHFREFLSRQGPRSVNNMPPPFPMIPPIRGQPPPDAPAARRRAAVALSMSEIYGENIPLVDRYDGQEEEYSNSDIERLMATGTRERREPEVKSLDKDNGRPEPVADEDMMVKMECKICFAQVATIVLLPCGKRVPFVLDAQDFGCGKLSSIRLTNATGHCVMCKWCADEAVPSHRLDHTAPASSRAQCPVCRKRVKQKVLTPSAKVP